LNCKIAATSENEEFLILADNLKIQIQNKVATLSEKWRIRSNTKWIEEGEKSTKYFFSMYKKKYQTSCSSKIRNPNALSSNSPSDTLEFIKNSYQQIYKKEDINFDSAHKITQNLPQISDEQNSSLTELIKEEEISNLISSLPNNKSPGSDGLTYEFYKLSKDIIVPVLTKLYNYILSSGNIPTSWCKSIITLIPKKSDDLENINNWRPISLVNTDAKMFMKILANRLNPDY
jgi:hypothetical protein